MCRRALPLAGQGALDLGAASRRRRLLRKEVIQPQVPLRLPCYDFIPITAHSFEASRPLRVQTAFMM